MTAANLPTPTLRGSSGLHDVWLGLTLPFRALRLIATTGRLAALSGMCAFITLGTLVALAVVLWPWCGGWAQRLVNPQSTAGTVASTGLQLAFFVVSFAAGALTVPNLVLAPLQDPLGEATERRCGEHASSPFSVSGFVRGVALSLSHTVLRVLVMGAGIVVLAPLNLVPAVGSALWLVTSSLWSMFWLSAEHLSNPMSRHLSPFGEVVRVLWRRPWLALGFGASLEVLLWVPVLNALVMPVAVVAGTLLYLALRQAGLLEGTKHLAPMFRVP